MSERQPCERMHNRAASIVKRGAGSAWARRYRLLALLGAALLPLVVRLLLMAEAGLEPRSSDLYGVLGDLALGLLSATVLATLARAGAAVLLAGCAVWLAMNLGYYEFMREYSSPFFLIHMRYAFDPEFLAGSGVGLKHPFLAVAAGAALIALAGLAGRGLRPGFRTIAVLLAIYLVAIQGLPFHGTVSPWRQRDFLSLNAADVAGRFLWPDMLEEDLEAGGDMLADYLEPDLSGVPLLAPTRRPTNVVIVFIEGIAGGQLPWLAQAHGIEPELRMPMLDAIARDNLAYSTFITHQKQTNRGLFGAFCGALPRLVAGLPEMTQIAEGKGRDCLPRKLADAGYETVFLNAAGRAFQSKGDFMGKIGFNRVLGAEDFDPGLWSGGWGPDDASLYGVALEEIEALRAGERPYFVAIETTSTHHPYAIPEQIPADDNPRRSAWAFADRAVANFVAQLRERGHLQDTLVLVTSDEATGVREAHRDKHGALAGYTENWGLMVALAPAGYRGRIDRAFQQADIPLSVLDYLGLAGNERSFVGRSFFRTYETPRTIYSANIYKGLIHEYEEGRTLTICTEMLKDCERFDMDRAPLFAFSHHRQDGSVAPSPLMRAVRAHSVLGRDFREPGRDQTPMPAHEARYGQ